MKININLSPTDWKWKPQWSRKFLYFQWGYFFISAWKTEYLLDVDVHFRSTEGAEDV